MPPVNLDLADGPPAPRLGLFDTLSILVGIVVGTAIFRSPPLVFQNCAHPQAALALWLLGGGLSLLGAFCYAELATSYRREGGDYAFLRAAFGPWAGFLFAWAQLSVVLTGSLSAMAYAFADYGARLSPLSEHGKAAVAAAIIVVITALNLRGAVLGRHLQNSLSLAKVVGLAWLVLSGLFVLATREAAPPLATPNASSGPANMGLALVFVLYAFGGWNDAAFVAAEVRDAERNLPRALGLGLSCVTIIYLIINWIYWSVLGWQGAQQSSTPAADVLQAAVGGWGASAMSLLVMVSAAGAIQGMIFTGARVYASVGVDHRSLRWLAHWDRERGVPVRALIAQAMVSMVLIGLVGTTWGRQLLDRLLQAMQLPAIPWDRYFGGFETLVASSAPIFWVFFLATGCSLFVLRARHPNLRRPFAVPFFPFTPLLFCAMCLYMLYSSLLYAQGLALLGIVPVASGALVYALLERPSRST